MSFSCTGNLYLKVCISHSRVLGVFNSSPKLVVERVWPCVNPNQVRECLASLQPDRPVCVVQGLEEGGLQLGQEGLEHGAGLRQQDGQGVQNCGLHIVREPDVYDNDDDENDDDDDDDDGDDDDDDDDLEPFEELEEGGAPGWNFCDPELLLTTNFGPTTKLVGITQTTANIFCIIIFLQIIMCVCSKFANFAGAFALVRAVLKGDEVEQ